jgi:hypothetical protein
MLVVSHVPEGVYAKVKRNVISIYKAGNERREEYI